MSERKCRCGNYAKPGYGDYCQDCYFDAFGDFIEENPIGGHHHPGVCEILDLESSKKTHNPDPNIWSDKYAIVLEMADMKVLGNFIANFRKPYRIPIGLENSAHNILQKKGKLVIVADKKTLLENPFDLCEADFDEALDLPSESET